MAALIAALPGDGIGPEVTAEGLRVLETVAQKYGQQFEMKEAGIGGAALDATESPFPPATANL